MIIVSFFVETCGYSQVNNGADLINNHINIPIKSTDLEQKEHKETCEGLKGVVISLPSETTHKKQTSPICTSLELLQECSLLFQE